MRTPRRASTFDRVLLFLDVTSDADSAMESAAALALRLQVPLMTVFVDHGDLQALEDHPFACTIELPTGLGHPVERGSLQRHWRAMARRTQRRLAQMASHHRLEAEFRLLRGDIRRELRLLSAPGDLMVVESSGRPVTPHTRVRSRGHIIARNLPAPVVFVGARHQSLRSVALLYDGSATAERGLKTALALTAEGEALLSLVCVGARGDEMQKLQSRVRRRMARQGRRVHIHARRICGRDTRAITYVATQMGANFMIVPACDTYPGGTDIDQLSQTLDCPVLVLRSQFGDESDDSDCWRAAVEG